MYKRAELYSWNAGNDQRAIADLTEALKLNLTDEKRSECLRLRGDCCKHEGSQKSLELALLDFTELDKMNPKMPNPLDSMDMRPPLQLRADVYIKMSEWNLALQDYTKALELVPDSSASFIEADIQKIKERIPRPVGE